MKGHPVDNSLDNALWIVLDEIRNGKTPHIIYRHEHPQLTRRIFVRLFRASLLVPSGKLKRYWCPYCEKLHTKRIKEVTGWEPFLCKNPRYPNSPKVIVPHVFDLSKCECGVDEWETTPYQIVKALAKTLNIVVPAEAPDRNENSDADFRLGMFDTKEGNRRLSMCRRNLNLQIGSRSRPIDEILLFKNLTLQVREDRFYELLGSPKLSPRERQREETKARDRDFHEQYVAYKEKFPGKPNTWIAKRIFAHGRSYGRQAETIRKHMVKTHQP